MARIILVSGGCRSGKSRFALEQARGKPGLRSFIATCPRIASHDGGEMDRRISRHQSERSGDGWETIEEELEIARILTGLRGNMNRSIVLDCLTLWVNNQMYHATRRGEAVTPKAVTEDEIRRRCAEIVESASGISGHLFLVTSEVGLGLVPENGEGRLYRDLLGSCNQTIAERADEVFFLVSGIPLKIK